MRYLSETDLAGLEITAHEAVDAIEALFRDRAANAAWSAPTAVIQPGDGRYMMAALAAADEPALLAVKTVILNPRNTERGLAQINGLVTVLDGDTGRPVAIMDGNWITGIRTAALSGVAAKSLARPDAAVAGFIGCGVQARWHLRILAAMFPIREIRQFGRGRANIDALGATARELGLSVVSCGSGQEAADGSDLIVSSVTYSPTLEPFLDARRLKPGAFAAVTDLCAPWIDEGLAGFDRIVIDDLAQEAAMENKLAPAELVAGDLGGLVRGEIAGRSDAQERTAFIFRAHPFGDLALAGLACRKALERSCGTLIES